MQSKPLLNQSQYKLTVEVDDDETAFLMANPKNKEMLLKSIEQDRNGETIAVNIND